MPRVALHDRLAEVAERGHHDGDGTERDADPPVAVEEVDDGQAQPARTQETVEPAKPLHDFFGEIIGAIGCLPGEHADGVAADVGGDGHQDERDDRQVAVVLGEQQRDERPRGTARRGS